MLAALPDGAVALLDGLIASGTPEVVVPEAARLRLVVLVYMLLGGRHDDNGRGLAGVDEHRALSAAAAVLTTSDWTRRWLLDRYARTRPACTSRSREPSRPTSCRAHRAVASCSASGPSRRTRATTSC